MNDAVTQLIINKALIMSEIDYLMGRLKSLENVVLKNKGFPKLIKEYKAKLADLREVQKVLNL